jgi:co-chaperonin GroES (HSP10)
VNAPTCHITDCRNVACAAFGGFDALLCAKHACEDMTRAARELRPLFRPLNDFCVILRDKPKEGGGRIIIPDSAKDKHGRVKGFEHATGVVLAVGPGYQQRAGKDGLTGPYLRERKPVHVRAGTHVVFRTKNEAHIGAEWRGLAIVHAFDVLAELEEENHEEATSDCAATA